MNACGFPIIALDGFSWALRFMSSRSNVRAYQCNAGVMMNNKKR